MKDVDILGACRACRFSQGANKLAKGAYYCKRNPPQVVRIYLGDDIMTAWPTVEGDDVCGDFKAT